MDQDRLHIVPKHYLYGPRKLNIVLTQLRCSAPFLNNELYRVNIIPNSSCQCGAAFWKLTSSNVLSIWISLLNCAIILIGYFLLLLAIPRPYHTYSYDCVISWPPPGHRKWGRVENETLRQRRLFQFQNSYEISAHHINSWRGVLDTTICLNTFVHFHFKPRLCKNWLLMNRYENRKIQTRTTVCV